MATSRNTSSHENCNGSSSRSLSAKIIDLTGLSFGRLDVVEFGGVTRDGKAKWKCVCSCGKEVTVTSKNLRRGSTNSCGCLRVEATSERSSKTIRGAFVGAAATARRAGRRLDLNSYQAMIARCYNPKNPYFKSYGGAGRTVDDRWLFGSGDKSGFECFLEDMPPRPSKEMTLDRTDNSSGYGPSNCRWATKAQQAANRG